MVPLSASVRRSTEEGSGDRSTAGGDERPSGTGLTRTALGVVGIVALAYFASRRAGFSDRVPSVHRVCEQVGDGVPADGRETPTEESTEEGGDEERVEGTEDSSEATAEEVVSEDVLDEDQSSEAIAERAAEDVQAESPEPGEMAVDEDVVDDVVDEEIAASDGDEAEEST